MTDTKILIVDDEDGLRNATRLWLNKAGFDARAQPDGESALTELVSSEYDVVLCDVRMPRMNGLHLLGEIRKRDLARVVIMMSAFGDSESALEAIRAGANDYIAKPFKRDELLFLLRKNLEREQLVLENSRLKDALKSDVSFANIISKSPRMHEIFRMIRKVADFKSTVLISGESGTGKELIARALHFHSNRRDAPFIPVNCGAIPENLLESELFGHVKGAFTDASRSKTGLFEEAHHGTLFLDEVGTLPLNLQVKLLRVLQEHEIRRVGDTRSIDIDVRIIAAGIDDLAQLVEADAFREDLYYRLNVIPIHVPPLRERREDIPLLVEHFRERHNERLGTRVRAISAEAMDALCAYHWPGNVRQLENTLERTIVLCDGESIGLEELPARVRSADVPPDHEALVRIIGEDELSIKKASRALEAFLIERALRQTEGNRTQAAKILEISHRTLLYKLKDYDLQDVK